jgi:hypothetical protein
VARRRLFGATAEQAFYVKCDSETNRPNPGDRTGKVIVEVGIAPVKLAEFVVFTRPDQRDFGLIGC